MSKPKVSIVEINMNDDYYSFDTLD